MCVWFVCVVLGCVGVDASLFHGDSIVSLAKYCLAPSLFPGLFDYVHRSSLFVGS